MDASEISQIYQIRRLKKDETIESFDCGDDDLNDFILNESQFYRSAKLAVSYVIEHKSTKAVAGFFSLANDKISTADFDNKTEFNRFRKQRFVNRKRLKSYPAAKICRLAIDNSAQGESLGTFILDFIKSYFVIDNKTGCRFITVDAYVKAVPFYLKNHFMPLLSANPDAPDEHTRLLFFDLDTIIDDE